MYIVRILSLSSERDPNGTRIQVEFGKKKRHPHSAVGFLISHTHTHSVNHTASLLKGKFMCTRHHIMNASREKIIQLLLWQHFLRAHCSHTDILAQETPSPTDCNTHIWANEERAAILSGAGDFRTVQSDIQTGPCQRAHNVLTSLKCLMG